MNRPLIFMYSGQGSQYYHMGRDLFQKHPVFQHWMKRLDEVAADLTGTSILAQIYAPYFKASDIFDRFLYSHPAIFMVEYALTQVFLEKGIAPDKVLGSSLGEFAAATVAGVLTPEKAMEAVVKQAEIFEQHLLPGGMMAILHDTDLFKASPFLHQSCTLAALHFPSNFVISGTATDLDQAEAALRKRQIVYQRLPVKYSIHCETMDPAGEYYKAYLRQLELQLPTMPLISCATADALTSVPWDHFWFMVRHPIRFQETIEALEADQTYTYVDLGPSGTTANFVKYNLGNDSKSQTHYIMNPFGNDLDNLETVQTTLLKRLPSRSVKEAKPMKAFLFPGQGSQKKGMGEGLFAEFKELTAQADEILGYSMEALCMENPDERLTNTLYTQPALYVVNALTYLQKIRQTGERPDYLAGHSLGEYDALFAAEVYDFATGLRLVKKRAELMAQAQNGGMAAVIGLNGDVVRQVLADNGLETIDMANNNSPGQMVIAGPVEAIAQAQPFFEKAGARLYIPLKVSGAFHSRYMTAASEEFGQFLSGFQFNTPTLPVISNVEARPYRAGDVARLLTAQINHPVQWNDTVRYLMGKQVETYEEIGPGNVLTGLVRNIRKDAEPLVVPDEPPQPVASPQPAVPAPQTPPVQTMAAPAVPAMADLPRIDPGRLGDEEFKKDYRLKYAYLTGAMFHGIASADMVVKVGQAGMLGFFGTGGLSRDAVETAINSIRSGLSNGEAWGMNLLYNPNDPEWEETIVDLFLRTGVRHVEAASYMQMVPSLVRYRLVGLSRNGDGGIHIQNRVMGKLSRPEVAELFLSPAPERIVKKLLDENKITPEQAELAKHVPMADDICAEADSGGHTDGAVAYALLPAIMKQRDEMMARYNYAKRVRVGAAGGIGTPASAAAAFTMGADFILTGSINQCTVEADNSDSVKNLLQQINVQDTEYAPAGDMFEMGAKIQVVRKGVFFPARANKLFELYRRYNSLEEIDEKTKRQIQDKYFKRSFEQVWADTKQFFQERGGHHEIERARQNPKYKMSLIFRWYFGYSRRAAAEGNESLKVDYQVHCGPALGAFNQWVKGSELEDWRNRRVADIGIKVMTGAAEVLTERFREMIKA